MKKLFLLVTIFTFVMSSNSAFAQKGNDKGNGKAKTVIVTNNGNSNDRVVVLNRPVRRVYTTPSNKYGRRPMGVRHDNGKHKGWYKGKARRRVIR